MKRMFFINLAWLVILSAAVGMTYYMTKTSYHAVGLVDGKTFEQERLIGSLKKIKHIHTCDSTADSIQEIVSVKSTSLYYVKTEDDAFHFCIHE